MTFRTQLNRLVTAPNLIGLGLVAGVFLIIINFSQVQANRWLVRNTKNNQSAYPVTWPRLDVLEVSREGGSYTLSGYLWNTAAGKHHFELASDGGVVVLFGDAIVYNRPPKGSLVTEEFKVELPAGAIPITIEYQAANPLTPRFEVSLREGGQLIAPWRLYPAPPQPDQVTRQWWAWHGVWVGIWLLIGSFILGLGLAARSLASTRLEWIAIGVIAALAISIRLLVAYERYQSVPDFYAMESIWDNFVVLGRSFLIGDYALAGSYYQQGAIVYMALAQVAVGPGLWSLYIFNATTSGLACVLILLASWTLFGRNTGLLAGTLMALYAPLIHYQTTFQIEVPAMLAGSLAVACGAWLLRRPGWSTAAAYGLAVALGTLSRSTLIGAVIGGPLAAWFASGNLSRPRRLSLGGVAVLSFTLAMLPMVLANASVGVYSVSSKGFPIAFFRGNNRDTMGVNEYFTDREVLARRRAGEEDNFNRETLLDIRADVPHWLKFLIHKAGMFWSGHEYSDRMIDFYTTGLATTGILRGLWLGGIYSLTTVVALTIIGAALNWRDPPARAATIFLGSIAIAFMGFTVLFPVTGRVRTPIQPALFPLAAMGIITLTHQLKQWRTSWRSLAIAGAAAIAAIALAYYCETQLPGPTTVPLSQLPTTLIKTETDFDAKVRLIGYDAFDSDFRSEGYLDLTLYWQALQPLDTDYTAYLHLLNPSFTRVGGIDRLLGNANFPAYPSSQWQAGEIVRQSYFIPLPKLDGAVPLQLIAGLRQNDQRLPVTHSLVEVLDGTAATIAGAAILPAPTAPTPALPRPLNLTFASELSLTGANLNETEVYPAGTTSLAVKLDWRALAHPPQRYHLFLHLLDRQGTLVAQFDGPPSASFPTYTWPPNSEWRGEYQINLPQPLAPGAYQLTAGLYRLGNLERLPIAGPESILLSDNRFLLSTIQIAP